MRSLSSFAASKTASATSVSRVTRRGSAKLAKIGAHVTKRLNANALVQQVEHPDAQIYLYQGFLSAADCKTLIGKIDADAIALLSDLASSPLVASQQVSMPSSLSRVRT